MFEPGRDQASGLRGLFAPAPLSLLPFGCTAGDASDRLGAMALARALQRAGRRPLLIDLLEGDPPGRSDRDGRCPSLSEGRTDVVRIGARRLLAHGSGADDLVALSLSLHQRGLRCGLAYDVVLVAADPLRLADLAAGLTDRLLLLTRADPTSVANVYAQIKAVGLAYELSRHVVVFHEAASPDSARLAHRRLAETAARFLDTRLDFGGSVAPGASDTGTWDRLAADALRWARPIEDRQAEMIH